MVAAIVATFNIMNGFSVIQTEQVRTATNQGTFIGLKSVT